MRTLTDNEVEYHAEQATFLLAEVPFDSFGPTDAVRMHYDSCDGWNKFNDDDRAAIHARVMEMCDE